MQIGLRVAREVEVHHHVHRLDVDPSGQQVGAHEVAAEPLAEVVEHAVAVLLVHPRVDVVAGIAELGDLLRQQLHALGRIAEDDRLVDLQLKGEREFNTNNNRTIA